MRFDVQGTPLPVLVCHLEAGEEIRTEKNAMSWMSPNMEKQSSKIVEPEAPKKKLPKGLPKGLPKLARKPYSTYIAKDTEGMIAMAASFPGEILVLDVTDEPIIAQKHAFLACEATVERTDFLNKKLGAGLFGGEGFIMLSFSGTGSAAFRLEGSVMTYELEAGQTMIVKTGCLAMMTASCTIEIELRKSKAKVGNKLLVAESDFNTTVTGPGKIWLQSMPVYSKSPAPYTPTE